MAATATATGTANWSTDGTWAITGIGTASGADGVLVSGVLTPTVSPAWTVGALVGRRMKLDATWYDISANTATTATITSPPADLTYAYLLGGSPLAGDTVDLASYVIVDDVLTIPSSGKLALLTATTTGQLTVAMSVGVTQAINADAITAGTRPATPGIILTSGSAGTLNISANGGSCACTGGSNTTARCINHAGTSAATVNIIGSLTGGTFNQCDACYNGSTGSVNVTGNITGGTANVNGLYNKSTGSITINGPSNITAGTGAWAYGVLSESTGTVTFNAANGGVNLINTASCVAYGGRPPVWNITDKANYIQMLTVNADGRGSQVMRFYLAPEVGEVVDGTLGGFEDGANPPSYAAAGTRVDPLAEELLIGAVCGDPAAPIYGTQTLPNTGVIIVTDGGTDNPDVSGTYVKTTDWDGRTSWTNGTYYIWWAGTNTYILNDTRGDPTNRFFRYGSPIGVYYGTAGSYSGAPVAAGLTADTDVVATTGYYGEFSSLTQGTATAGGAALSRVRLGM